MTICQMRCFLTLADLLNFTRTAEVLNMSQPALSKMISGIEDEVGVPLVQRTKRSVVLTNAGQVLCRYFKQILSEYHEGIEQAVSADLGLRGSVHIGFSSTLVADLLPQLVHQMSVDFPEVGVELYDGTQVELMQMLNMDELDIVFGDSFALDSYDNLIKKAIDTDKLGVLFHESHPFAKRKAIALEELHHEKLLVAGRLMQSPSSPSTTNSIINSVLYRNGLLPRITQVARTVSNMIVMVDCGIGVALVPSRMLAHAPKTVQFRPVICEADNPFSDIAISILAVWKQELKNPCITNVTDTIDAILKEKAQHGALDYKAE